MVSATGEATNASEITAPVAPSPNEIPEEDPQQEFEAAPRTDEGVFREIDSLAQDVRAKEQRSFLRGATSHRLHVDKKADIYARADMLDEDVKKKLAMKYSAAVSRPGAFDGDDRRSSTLSKPSYSQKERLAHVASQRHEEEQKRRRDIENTGPVIGPENEEDPLDDLQLRMNIFIDETNKEDKDEQKEQRIQQRRKRYRLLAATLIGLVAIVALLGVVIIGAGGSSTGDDMDSSDSGESFVACYSSSNETMQSYLYQELRSLLVAQHSELEASISTPSSDARKSLCWLAHDDALVIQVRPWWEDYWVLQRFSLGLIYFHFIGGDSATGGPVSALSTSNWLTATPICQWTFLRCGGSSGDEVTKLLFHSKTLSGSIPSQLALLTKLVHIEFTANLLIGTIPEEIWTMSQLELFKIDLNELTGTLSSELANLDRLQQLSLGSNQLTGNLPEMASLTNMERLDIYFSKMVGPFPNISGWNNLGERISGNSTGGLPLFATDHHHI
jgi:hypothetical protein